MSPSFYTIQKQTKMYRNTMYSLILYLNILGIYCTISKFL